jgi:hypothetical protein
MLAHMKRDEMVSIVTSWLQCNSMDCDQCPNFLEAARADRAAALEVLRIVHDQFSALFGQEKLSLMRLKQVCSILSVMAVALDHNVC